MTTIPQPKGLPLIGNIADIDPNAPVQSLMRLAALHGPLFRMEAFGRSMVIVGGQALVEELCDESRFAKALHRPLQELRAIGGDGLFTAYNEEPNWGKAHRLLMPAFGPIGLRAMVPQMLDIAEQMMLRWERFGEGATIDVADNMTRLTLDTIALCAFGYRFNSFYQNEMHPFVAAMVGALDEAGRRARRPGAANRLMLLHNRRFAADLETLRTVADRLIDERARDPRLGTRGDLLDRMLTAADPETGETLSRENIGYQMVTFLIAGHETTSGLLSFATLLLLRHPEALARARAEVDTVLAGATPDVDDLGRLGYLEQVLDETLRLWPTAPAFAVHPLAPTTIGGRYRVTPEDILLVLTPVLHRDPAVWDEPEAFRPERFTAEALAALPPHAWKPFGNGQRACIGRGFAMQEATLVLAMMLQRFDLSLADPDYTLAISETLTLKPAGLHVHARRRDLPAGTPRSRAPSAPTRPLAAPEAKTTTAPSRPLLVLYGSNTGTSEAFAQRIGAEAQAQGYAATVAAMDDYASGLPGDTPMAVVTASYEGQPPDNARRFLAAIEDLPGDALAGRRYAVFGCGNWQWARTYQAIPKRVDEALAAAGAEPLLPRGEGDASGDLFGAFDGWFADLWPALAASEGRESQTATAATALTVEVLRGERERALQLDELRRGTVIGNRELVDVSQPGARSRRHVTIRLPEGMTYRTGDYLSVLPSNPPEVVARALRRFALATDTQVVIHAAPGTPSSLPIDLPVAAGTLLADYVELQQPVTQRQVAALAETIGCPPERAEAARLATDGPYAEEVLAKRVSLLDLLERFGSADMALGAFLAALPPMRPRQYSIASSPLADPAVAALTFTVLEAPALAGHGCYRGVASTFLARLEIGDQVAVAVRPSQAGFHLPDDPAVPIIMICAGSGIAPFRGFIQERSLRKAAGDGVGPALLFFGIRDPDADFLHREELEQWQAEGVVSLRIASSARPVDGVAYVQDAMWRDRSEIAALFQAGGHIFVCGDGEHMAPAVRDTLIRIYQDSRQVTREDAEAWVETIEREAVRYVADVFA
ncbi:bifunctional cytochrome P450/NADPH--P450 reductase [Sphingomonas melonis]|uniref:Bifunctional cytochrome P450/NADPH--P450 reductase n=1 Tax=Sphingomonas melonis TaxID=152682 RepID=A0A7Y9FM02_9SPHN|nr:cytochrome P450 [Sphingomonas melonis]NYD89608.1 cytochrome P450/NADPH-cytochrome P450 reductase [Sphingomonas melonis]